MLKRITEEIELEKEFKGYSKDSIEDEMREKEFQINKLLKERDDLKKIIEIKDCIIRSNKVHGKKNEEMLMGNLSDVVQIKNKIIDELRAMNFNKEKVDVGNSPIKAQVEDKACSPKASIFKPGPIQKKPVNIRTRKMTRKK